MNTPTITERIRATAHAFCPGQDVVITDESLSRMALRARTFQPAAPKRGTEVDLFGNLLLNAVNYCYWVGRADYYPTGQGAAAMHKILQDLLQHVDRLAVEGVVHLGEEFVGRLAVAGFPLADRRIAHVREITARPGDTIRFIESICNGASPDETLARLLVLYPGFTGDPFLKRALLFVHLAQRVHGFFSTEATAHLPIPADYQVPKMLAHGHVLLYSGLLSEMIRRGELIPAGSRIETELRAASIVACDRIAAESGLTPGQIDDFLWSNRRSVTAPYHLTITTDY